MRKANRRTENGYIKYTVFLKERRRLRKAARKTAVVLSCALFVTAAAGVFMVRAASSAYASDIAEVQEQLEKTLEVNTELEEAVTTLSQEANNNAVLIKTLTSLNSKYQTESDRLRELVDMMNIEGNNIKADPNNLRVKCNATEEQLNRLLENSALAGHGWEFLEAEHKYGVNAIMMMSIMKQESGLGKHNAASYNAVGMKTRTGEWRPFDSFQECIDELAKLLGEQYLDENGKFFNGMSITDVNVRYCLNVDGTVDWEWSQRIKEHSYKYLYTLKTGE